MALLLLLAQRLHLHVGTYSRLHTWIAGLPYIMAMHHGTSPAAADLSHTCNAPLRQPPLPHFPAVLPICMSGKFVYSGSTTTGMASIMRYSVSNLAPDSSKLWCAALLLGLCVVALRGFFVGYKWHALVSANSPMTCVF